MHNTEKKIRKQETKDAIHKYVQFVDQRNQREQQKSSGHSNNGVELAWTETLKKSTCHESRMWSDPVR
jgi:hypothetical protein